MECLPSAPEGFTYIDSRARAFRLKWMSKSLTLAAGNCSLKPFPSPSGNASNPIFMPSGANCRFFRPLSSSRQVDADSLSTAFRAGTSHRLALLTPITFKTGSLSMPSIMLMGRMTLSTNTYLMDTLCSLHCLKRILSGQSSY